MQPPLGLRKFLALRSKLLAALSRIVTTRQQLHYHFPGFAQNAGIFSIIGTRTLIPYTEPRQIEDINDETSSDSSSLQIKVATFSHHDSLLELESSANEGCTLCGRDNLRSM
jgi:hypothetical protein